VIHQHFDVTGDISRRSLISLSAYLDASRSTAAVSNPSLPSRGRSCGMTGGLVVKQGPVLPAQ